MGPCSTRIRGPLVRSLAALLLGVLALTGCVPRGNVVTELGATGGSPVRGGTATMALPPASTPNWIFPIGAPGYLASYNSAIQNLLYPRLFMPEKKGGALTMESPHNLAGQPRYSDGNRTVTIRIKKGRAWSDGTPVTTRDVQFWFELIRHNKKEWAGYSPGLMPDDVTSFDRVDDRTFRLRLDRAYNPTWFTANELRNVVALPVHAWNPAGEDPKTAFARLMRHAKSLSQFATDPLWKTVDGPWTIEGWNTSGRVSLVPNTKYRGPDKPHLDRVVLKPFTTTDSEFNVLRAGGIDYGYLPPSVMAQSGRFRKMGYRIDPWESWAVTYIVLNFHHPTAGPLLRQSYLRQALQRLIDQKSLSDVVWHGSAAPTLGPVPAGLMDGDPYPYDPGKAKALLAAHGWAGRDGTLRCVRPGSGPRDCGEGIKDGQELRLSLLSQSGSTETSNTMQAIKSEFDKAHVTLDIRQQPLNTVLGTTVPCKKSEPVCGQWQLGFFGSQGSWYFPADPSGESVFATNGPSNMGNWSDPKTDRLIRDTEYSDDPAALRDYGHQVARQLPVLWVPNPAYQVSAIRNDLRGVDQNPTLTLAPQDWYFVRKGGTGA
ncbi:peptide ABC transporter substrate-binding protein [Streptomyces pinistramenti]|uniref:peptide ABC transporter substrate-binding protein n=1 Tax=Streptomyces pinistramenti TaxID=2884812 RepID=UPI001D07B0A6|nr:peptide ABC transporter substrate-binding protein [Streptomyces pinistramenti]MCB5912221.1 peptide ABC transporter substrate-binding protein [Streptomyces pinistramenti]